MLEISNIKASIKDEKEMRLIEIKNRKNNINSNYLMAKHDFRVIENLEDSVETLGYLIEKLNDLQERIIDRNNQRLV